MTIIGGNYHLKKESSIVKKLSTMLNAEITINGTEEINDYLEHKKILKGLSIWMPDFSNDKEKSYPKKAIGTCLICSKVVRREPGQHEFTEAVSRIFKMNGNAVIAVERTLPNFTFTLIDALGNIWVQTKNLEELTTGIYSFYDWFKQQKRKSIKKASKDKQKKIQEEPGLEEFLEIVRANASRVQQNSGERYFGNCSTRCQKTFPVYKMKNSADFLVSARNISKEEITKEDLVLISEEHYHGDKKPSVDTPIQLELYKKFPKLKFMIHGHAFFEEVKETKTYCCCGDLRELSEIEELIESKDTTKVIINLKKHGYLIATETLAELKEILENNIPVVKPFREV